jgi:hypothetical protein
VNDEFVLSRIDIRDAAMINREVQPVRRHGAAEQVVRRARMRVAKFTIWIAQRPRYVLFKWRRRLDRGRVLAEFQTPWCIGHGFGSSAGYRSGRAHGSGNGDATSKQCSSIDQSVAGNVIDRWRAPPAPPFAHDFLPDEWRYLRLISRYRVSRYRAVRS